MKLSVFRVLWSISRPLRADFRENSQYFPCLSGNSAGAGFDPACAHRQPVLIPNRCGPQDPENFAVSGRLRVKSGPGYHRFKPD